MARLVLHPRYKLEYFAQQDWELSWIAKARELCIEIYSTKYSTAMVPLAPAVLSSAWSSSVSNCLLLLAINSSTYLSVQFENIFDDMMAPPASVPYVSAESEIEIYLSLPTEYTADALRWWHDRQATYPRLFRMARDYLTIPGV